MDSLAANSVGEVAKYIYIKGIDEEPVVASVFAPKCNLLVIPPKKVK